MLVLTIILITLLLLFAGFLISPIILYVDTDHGRYEIFQSPVFRFYIASIDGVITPKLKLFGMEIQLKSQKKTPESKSKEHRAKQTSRKSFAAWQFLIERIVRSFKVKTAVADLDTGDVVLNAQLIPVFMLVSHRPVMLTINFIGRTYFHLEVSNRPGRILWIFLKFLTKK